MVSLVGIVIVLGSVLGGFLMERGKLPVLLQPSEFVTIVGAAAGMLIAANPVRVLKGVGAELLCVVKGRRCYGATLCRVFEDALRAVHEGTQRRIDRNRS